MQFGNYIIKLNKRFYDINQKIIYLLSYLAFFLSNKEDKYLNLYIENMEFSKDFKFVIFNYLKQKLLSLFPLPKDANKQYDQMINRFNIASI